MTRELGGIPIDGNYYAGTSVKEQHDHSIFIDALIKLLENEHVDAVRWQQYTPHFMDGDPCVFSANDPSVKSPLFPDENGGELEDGWVESYYMYDYEVVGTRKEIRRRYDWGRGKYKEEEYERPVLNYDKRIFKSPEAENLYEALKEFASVLCGGHHDNLLVEKFGDHANVIATKDSVTVEHYDHD